MSRFLPYIQNLRGAAILFVVGVHARGNVGEWGNSIHAHNFLQTLFDSREGNGTVMFIFIAGFLFQHLYSGSFNFRKYLDQKFRFVLVPYLLISIPLIIFRLKTGFDSETLPDSVVAKFFYFLATGAHLAPFWFISTMALFYLSGPMLYRFDNPRFYRYALPVLLLICFFTYRPHDNANPFFAYVHYLPVYVLGMFVARYHERILSFSRFLLIPFVGIYGVIASMEMTSFFLHREIITFEDVIINGVFVFNIYMLKALLLCFIVLMFFYEFVRRRVPILEVLGEYSFGIYFLHFIFIVLSKNVLIEIRPQFSFTFLSFLIFMISILCLSTLAVFVIKKLSGSYSRIVIGS
jgi:peptidoglycan/LPS O-acetylase OafA/YrhL